MKRVILTKDGFQKAELLNPLIYKREIKNLSSLRVQKGELVEVISDRKKFLGIGYINVDSKITLRFLTFEKEDINREFFKRKILEAVKKRESLNNITNSYRLIHSEADFLPGLIVDKYDEFLSIQFNTAGIYRFKDEIISTLSKILNPKGIYQKVDENVAKIEDLPTKEGVIFGEVPNEIILKESDIKFSISLKEGQKTGFFLDQRKNRRVVASYIKNGDKVLDLFSNAGGFGIYAYKNKAEFVHFVDISEVATRQIEENCKLNNLKNYKITTKDAFKFLEEESQKYDLIIIDPPSFAKNRAHKEKAIKAYQYLLVNSIPLLEKDGKIAIFSCSHNIAEDDLKRVLLFASSKIKKEIRVLEHLYQDIDHPYIVNIPNSLYLRGYLIKLD